MNVKQAEQEMKMSEALVCSIPLKPNRVVSIPELQQCVIDAKNKGQIIRCFARWGSQHGCNSNADDPKYWAKMKEYIEDFTD